MNRIALLAPEHLLVPGTQLNSEDTAHVLAAYVHRFTGDHKPNWALRGRRDGSPYHVQFANDADWLHHTKFVVTENGRLDHRYKECFSSPTWPDDPELRRPIPQMALATA